uniref:Uncharacterized protein n=1 Tax=Cucumis melo TaxID=3656 RepID=A0A9I9ELU8_CUCME
MFDILQNQIQILTACLGLGLKHLPLNPSIFLLHLRLQPVLTLHTESVFNPFDFSFFRSVFSPSSPITILGFASKRVEFCLCLILTLLGYVPGIIYVVYAIALVDHDQFFDEYRCPLYSSASTD